MIVRTLAPLALLLAYATAFGAAAFGLSVVAFDDHPGQLYRVWHAVAHGVAPWRWNDGWWAGYPELQFYPPALSYAGALLHHASLGRVSIEAAYQTLVWLAWMLPGVTTWALLTRVLGSGWLALPAAFVALTLSAGVASGVEGGVRTGMVAARLGWALLPLLALVLLRERGRKSRVSLPAAAVLALIVLTHPAHGPAAVAIVAVDTLAPRTDGRRRWVAAAGTLSLALALTAFWTLPLAARLSETRALAWGRFSPVEFLGSLLYHPALAALLLLALASFRLGRTPPERTLALVPWVAVAIVALDGAVLEPLGVRWLPADRLTDGAWLTFVLAAGVAIGRLLERIPARRHGLAAAASLAVVAAFVTLSWPSGTLMPWPRRGEWPTLAATVRGLRLDDLWAALGRAPAGRVLFVRSGIPLVYGTAWWRPHTHVTALAPLHTGRAILNGTFTHPSPIAALVYRGTADRAPITALAETLDGQSLFGRPLPALDDAVLRRYADPLRVSAIVALEDDAPALAILDGNARLTRLRVPRPFVAWARTPDAALPERVAADRWRLQVSGAPGQWVSTGIAYYPLWSASDGGSSLPTRRGALGDLELQIARPRATVELAYSPGPPEIAGVAVTAAALVSCAGVVVSRRAGGAARGRARG
ncbi:MAG: hypothetical protein HYU51_14860 [Candidatus Rokubacteria bacterium]|nr:hypothetical protein [Candidatus Rokubacteria bacterium]